MSEATKRVVEAARKYVHLVQREDEASFDVFYAELVPALAALDGETQRGSGSCGYCGGECRSPGVHYQ